MDNSESVLGDFVGWHRLDTTVFREGGLKKRKIGPGSLCAAFRVREDPDYISFIDYDDIMRLVREGTFGSFSPSDRLQVIEQLFGEGHCPSQRALDF